MLEPDSLQPIVPPGAPRVLVAEDNALNRKLFRMVLATEGLDVTVVENGLEAVRVVESDPHWDLILMDLQMPVMDGLEAAKRIREQKGDIPIVAVSAFLKEVGRENCERVMDDYLEKPFRRDQILEMVHRWVHV